MLEYISSSIFISLYIVWEEIRSTRVIIFLFLAEIISFRCRHLFSNMSMDFSADAIAFFVSGIILLKKASESDNWLTFSPLSSKDLVMATLRDLYCSCKLRRSSIFFSNTCFDIHNSSFSSLNEVSQLLVIGFIF